LSRHYHCLARHWGGKVDANQAAIVKQLRGAGVTVRSTAQVGSGFPDIAVGWQGKTYLFEVKDSNKPPSARKLTEMEQAFFDSWKGHALVVTTAAEIAEAIGLDPRAF
jgi:hypothetical protein